MKICKKISLFIYFHFLNFHFRLAYTKRTLPQLIKYCVDIDCNSSNDGGIAPKNICKSCLENLQAVFEFKMKSQESDKYLNQIISHSTAQQPAPQPFDSYPNDEDSLLEPLDVEEYQYQPSSSIQTNDIDLGKGQRHGEFKCHICLKSFKYVKPYKNHMKIHKKTKAVPPAPLSYYKRKKLEAAAAAGISLKKPLIRALLKKPQRTQQETTVSTPDRELEKLHADYDSICPAPYENEQKPNNSRDSSPDFGALMLSTSEYIGNEVLEEVKKDIPRSRTGRPVKRSIVDDDFSSSNQNVDKKYRNIAKKKSEGAIPTKKKPGPLSKTRGKTSKEHDSSEEVIIDGFCEVDISKMLKKSRSNDIGLIGEKN